MLALLPLPAFVLATTLATVLPFVPPGKGIGAGSPPSIGGEPWFEIDKWIGTPNQSGDFGNAISWWGDRVLIGAPDDGPPPATWGAAYVLAYDGSAWVQEARLSHPIWLVMNLGAIVSLHGDTAAVGTGDFLGMSSAHVFARHGTTWTLEADLPLSAGSPANDFGASLSLGADLLVVGAPLEYSGGVRSGAVFAYTRAGTLWSEEALLGPPVPDWGDAFGTDVCLSGNTLAVGAPDEYPAGAVYLYERHGTQWTLQTRIPHPDPQVGDSFSGPLCFDGDTLLIGNTDYSPGMWSSGAAYVFVTDGSSWTQQARLTASDGERTDYFGCSVSLSGDTAAIGAWGKNDGATDAGAAYVFERTGSAWQERAKFNSPEVNPLYDHFGRAVAVQGDVVLVGSPGEETDQGAVYVYSSHPLARAVFRNDSYDSNPPRFVAARPILGANWIATVDNTGSNNILAGVQGYVNPLELYLPVADAYLLVDLLSPGGELLHLAPAFGDHLVTFQIPIPLDAALMGFRLSVQGGGFGGGDGTNLHNAYDLMLGYE